MIFQAPIDLKIDNRTVQAIVDFDTGFIGFTEEIEKETVEYYYGESPVEFKKALMSKLETIFAEKSLINFKVSGKNKNMRYIEKYLRDIK